MASRTSGKESAVCGITAAGAVGAAVALGAAVDAGAEVVPEELLLLEEASRQEQPSARGSRWALAWASALRSAWAAP